MNAKMKTIITIIIAIICILGLIGYVYAKSNNSTSESKLRENCFTMNSTDLCIRLSKEAKEQKHKAEQQGIEADKKIAELMS